MDLLDSFLQNSSDNWVCFVDGSSLGSAKCGSRGPSGSAALLILSSNPKKIQSKTYSFPEDTTNNVAELTAVSLALDLVEESKEPKKNIRVMTDSKYVQGMLDLNWQAKANVELIQRIKARILSIKSNISFHWVKGHSKIVWNEMVDKLAKEAALKNKK
jgi:ribonuclease HI